MSDEYEVHDVSCDMDVDCTCGASSLAEAGRVVEANLAVIHEPADHRSLVVTYFALEPEPETAHRDFGPLEI